MLHPILLYDGVCGLCNRLVQFILRRDAAGVFQFASPQNEVAGRILARHEADAGDLDTFYVVVNCDQDDEKLLSRSDAVIFILRQLGAAELCSAHPGLRPGSIQSRSTQATIEPATTTRGLLFWRLVGAMLQLVPQWLRDWGYSVVARNRYRVFGRYDSCPVPTVQTRG